MKNVVIALLAVVALVLAGWFIYQKGHADDQPGIQIDLPGGSPQGGY